MPVLALLPWLTRFVASATVVFIVTVVSAFAVAVILLVVLAFSHTLHHQHSITGYRCG